MSSLPDLESLQCFVEAAQLGSFRKAAGRVGLTPAALGQRIRKLEELWEVTLFARTTRAIALTEAGTALLPVAREALVVAARCEPVVRGESGPPAMHLTLGTRHELGISWVQPALSDLEDAFPNLTFHLYFGSGEDLERQVRQGSIDAAISSRRISSTKVVGLDLHRETYTLVGASSLVHSLPFRRRDDAAQHTLVDIDDDRPLFRYWREAPGGGELRFAGLRRMGTIEAIRLAVLQGEGIAVLPTYHIAKDLECKALRPLLTSIKPNSDQFRLLIRQGDPREALFTTIAQHLRQVPLS